MEKNEAVKAAYEIAARLNGVSLLCETDGCVSAALTDGDGRYFFAEIDASALNGSVTVWEAPLHKAEGAAAAALSVRPEATVALCLRSRYATMLSERTRPLRAELDDMSQIVGLTARVAKNAAKREIGRALNNRSGCFVRHEGMLITGRSIGEAITGAILLEKAAMTHLLAKKIGGAKRVPLVSGLVMRSVYQKKYSRINLQAEAAPHGPAEQAEIWPSEEDALRREIVRVGMRLAEEGLVQGTWGNIGVRLDDAHMLVTPSGIAYHLLAPGDIVRVRLDSLEYEGAKKPTSEKRLHRDVFAARPEVGAVIHTHARMCGVFAAAKKTIVPQTDASCTRLGGEIRCGGHALPSTKRLSRQALSALGKRNACMLKNHGAVCCGVDLEDAFLCCREAERAAAERLS